ncbi:MAG: phage major capsid protein [Chloroflexi bacterium]|nr:phage major capsid protein [Chloroflexota bacterium]
MTEEIKAQDAPQVDVAAIARQAAEEAVKAYRAQLEAEPPAVKGAALTNPATPKAQPETFKSLGDELQAVARWSMNGTTDRRLDALKATGLGEDINSQAGFLVQTDFAGGLLQNMHESGAILSRVRRIPISAGSNGLKLNAVDESSRANGSRWGGVTAYWAAEAGTATASKPKFRQMNLELNKLLAFCYATDELLADSTALESVISQAFAEEMTYKVEDAVIRGTGAGQPLGILNNSSVYVSVAKETGQDADTFTYDNAVKMWSRMWAPSRRNAVWFINQDVEPQLYSMTLAAGTAGVPVYMPAGGISGAPYGTLFGRPVIAIEQADTVGDLGDVMLLDLSQYLMIDKGGLQAASSLHVMFLYAEQVFRFIYRTDGQPAWNSSLTPANSSNTLSPFVLLDARA